MTNLRRNVGNRILGFLLSLALVMSWIIPPSDPTAVALLIDFATPTARAASEAGQLVAREATADNAMRTRAAETFSRLPLMFEANEGQTDGDVKFLARGPGYKLFLTANEAVMVLRGEHSAAAPQGRGGREKSKLSPRRTARCG